jgi:hypothetical protein
MVQLELANQWGGCGWIAALLSFGLMGKPRKPNEDKPFTDDFLEWIDSQDGQEYIELSDLLWPLMENVRLDVNRREFIWPDNTRLDFSAAAGVIHQQHQIYALADVKEFLISWIENYAPASMSQEQLGELDHLLENWVDQLNESM